MTRHLINIVFVALVALNTSCRLAPQPPIAKAIPFTMEKFGDVRTDHYYWLQNRDSQDVLDYILAENNYTESIMEQTLATQRKLYNEMRSRRCEEDETVPIFQNGYYYYIRYEKGKEYPINCRRKGKMSAPEEIILDENDIAAGHEFCMIASIDISPNNKIMAYGIDTTGNSRYSIVFKDLKTGLILNSKIDNTTGSVAWSNDNQVVFYCQKNKSMRHNKIFKHYISSRNSLNDIEIYHETDPNFSVDVFTSKSMEYILIASTSTNSTEYRYIDANTPDAQFQVFQPRTKNHEYHIFPANNKFYIKTNWNAKNYRIMETSSNKTDMKYWNEVIPHNPNTILMDIDIFRDFMVVMVRKDALTKALIHKWSNGEEHYIDFGEETYTALPYANPEFNTNSYLYYYTSLTTPNTTFEYNMLSHERKILKQTEVFGNYNPHSYQTTRLWATASDSTKIPISIVHKKDLELNGQNPMLIYAYGAYGYSENPTFQPAIVSLLDRGFVYAIAHVRGGEEMGKEWYNQGRNLNKNNTFSDFITCTEYLIDLKYSSPELTIAEGNSAGGLLMGVIANNRPNLYKGIITETPFVDVVTSMLNHSTQTSTSEFDEWGNPNDSINYFYLKSYSPYDQVKPQNYPNILVTTNYYNSHIQYYEPTKWVAKLRANKTNDNLLLLKVDMKSEHNISSQRYKPMENKAFIYAFIFHILGIEA